MKYHVTITETSQRTVEVEADSRAEAEEKAEELWGKEEYVLDSGDFRGADFQAEEAGEKAENNGNRIGIRGYAGGCGRGYRDVAAL